MYYATCTGTLINFVHVLWLVRSSKYLYFGMYICMCLPSIGEYSVQLSHVAQSAL